MNINQGEMMSKNNKTSNTALWDQVFQTDPAFTKFVKVGRGFTAIDAFYQVFKIFIIFSTKCPRRLAEVR